MRSGIIFLSLFFLIVLQANAYTILLDPGHGGEDRGATRKIAYKVNGKKRVKYYFEKDLVLLYARKIQETTSETCNGRDLKNGSCARKSGNTN